MFKTSNLRNNFAVALYLNGQKTAQVALTGSSVNKTLLRTNIERSFSLGELDTLCQDIQQDLEDNGKGISISLDVLNGDNKIDKIRELINYLDRRQVLPYLIAAVRRTRPGIF